MRSIQFYIVLVLAVLTSVPSNAQQSDKEAAIYNSWVNHNKQFNYDSSMHYGDLYVNYHLTNGTKLSILEAYNHKIKSLRQFKKFDKGFKLALNTYDTYCMSEGSCINCNSIYMHLADFMVIMKDYRQGIKYLGMGCTSDGRPTNYFHKAEIYRLLNLPDSALQLTRKNITQAKQLNNPSLLIGSYNQHGIIAKKLGQYDAAINSFSTAINLIDSLNLDQNRYGYIVGNLGSCYYQKEDYSNAYKYLTIDASRSLKNRDIGSFISAEITLCLIDIKRKDYELVEKRTKALLKDYDNQLQSVQKMELLELLMQSYKSKGKSASYQFYLNQWITLNKSNAENKIETNQVLVEEYAANSLRQVTLQMETEKELLNQKLIVKEKEERASRLQKWLLAGGALFVILIILFFLSRYRKRALLKETQLKLAKKEQELLKLKVQEENRNVQVLSHELIVKQDFSANLIQHLEELDNLSKPELKNIEFFIQNELDIKSSRAHLQNQMGELSNNFYNELKINHPNLRELELKLAAMVVMQMSNKEIATSKNTTLESSKKAKNRLKKKLNISPSDDLTAYLLKFL